MKKPARSSGSSSDSSGKSEPVIGRKHADSSSEASGQRKVFHACYLLKSLCPRVKGRTYIGYTVNPRRRIRQHNGEITSGAFRTKKHRPWEMVLCVYGFPTNVSALQFEWAWQHPREAIALREASIAFKSFSGVSNTIKLVYTMLNLPQWQGLNLVVNYFSTKYIQCSAGGPSLQPNIKVQFSSIDDLPCYLDEDLSSCQMDGEDEEEEDSNLLGTTTEYNESMSSKELNEDDADCHPDHNEITEDLYKSCDIAEVSLDYDLNYEISEGIRNICEIKKISTDHCSSGDLTSQCQRWCEMNHKKHPGSSVSVDCDTWISTFTSNPEQRSVAIEVSETNGDKSLPPRVLTELSFISSSLQQREIIDLSSPSPCRLKAKSTMNICPVIIDLS